MNVLVISPHADDEILGCGGAIAKHSYEADKVTVYTVTEPYLPDWGEDYITNRRQKILEAHKILGVQNWRSLGFPTVKLDTVPLKEIIDEISKYLTEVDEGREPDIIYIPFRGDLNQDHRIVFHACRIATKLHQSKLLAYETLSETEWGFQPFVPNYYVDITKTLKAKLDAMRAYKCELQPYPHPRSIEVIKALALKRGSEVNLKFAEAFQLIREIG